MNSSSKPAVDPAVIRIIDSATAEFMEEEKVTSVRCDRCAGLIEMAWLGTRRSALSMRCSCGKFTGTIKGLLS